MVSDGQCFQLSMENMYLYICTYVCIKRNQSQSTIFSNLQSIYDWSLNEGPLVSLIYSVWGFPFCYSLSFLLGWNEYPNESISQGFVIRCWHYKVARRFQFQDRQKNGSQPRVLCAGWCVQKTDCTKGIVLGLVSFSKIWGWVQFMVLAKIGLFSAKQRMGL